MSVTEVTQTSSGPSLAQRGINGIEQPWINVHWLNKLRNKPCLDLPTRLYLSSHLPFLLGQGGIRQHAQCVGKSQWHERTVETYA
jgi:hypothetical protein